MREDALTLLRSLRSGVADIIFLDPPFNIGKRYGDSGPRFDRLPDIEYSTRLQETLVESLRVLRDGGSLFVYHLPRQAIDVAAYLRSRADFQHWIAISMKNGFARGHRLYPAHYALLHFSKGPVRSFHRPKVRPLTCPHCGEYVRSYGGYEQFVRGGINLSDVWDDVSPVRHTRYRLRAANSLPPIVLHRVVEMSGIAGGLLVDPFAGTGTSLAAAQLHKMYFIGGDASEEAFSILTGRFVNGRAEAKE